LPLEDVLAAALRIAPYVGETPIVPLTPTGIGLKAENLHPIGAFKIRGAFNALLSLDADIRARGVVAHSSGNHAQAVAYAAKTLGVRCAVVMPDNVSSVKLAATRYWGADVVLVPAAERVPACATLARERNATIIEPFDSLAIMAGTGTIALEILRQRPDVRYVTVPVSGGVLIGGVAAALAQTAPGVAVIGVEPAFANDAEQSFRKGEIVSLSPDETGRTMADGLRVPQLGRLPFANIRAYVRDIVSVTEDDIAEAVRLIAAQARLVAEPSGAVALAGALAQKFPPEKTVSVLSGGNVEPALYASLLGLGNGLRTSGRT
jgi:threonine dehydratase